MMDYGGCERRKTKKDLKRKRLARGYKRGGQFRTHNVSEVSGENKKKSKDGVVQRASSKGGAKRRY